MRRLLLPAAIAFTLTVAGCASPPITIRTNPTGAAVEANGDFIGETPLEIYADDYFASQRQGLEWQRSGTLRFTRAGCEPESVEVDTDLMRRSFTIDLDCEPGTGRRVSTDAVNRAIRPADPVPAPAPAPAAKPEQTDRGAVARLEELETMRERGLITDQEYQSLRKKVLDSF